MIVAALATAPACGREGGREVTVVDVAARACDRPTPDRGVGVVVAPNLVATAGHTVEGRRREVTVDDTAATVIAIDARTDLALLRAEVDGEVRFADEAPAAAVVVTPDGEVDVDILSTGRLVVHDTTDRRRYTRDVHTLTPGVPTGTSGAPLLDADGRLLGIVVLANRTDDTSYAVTADELRALIDRSGPAAAVSSCSD